MELQLENLKYQDTAIQAVIKVFDGTEKNTFDNACIEGIRSNFCKLTASQLADNIKAIAKNTNRVILNRWNTSYLKTAKEKNTNRYLNIKHYYKQIVELYRLEFVFGKKYFQSKEPLRSIEKTIIKALKKPFKFDDNFYLIS